MNAGPLHLVGDFEIVDALGNHFANSGIISLCRCGHPESNLIATGHIGHNGGRDAPQPSRQYKTKLVREVLKCPATDSRPA